MAAQYARHWQVHRQHSEPYTGLPNTEQAHKRKRQ